MQMSAVVMLTWTLDLHVVHQEVHSVMQSLGGLQTAADWQMVMSDCLQECITLS